MISNHNHHVFCPFTICLVDVKNTSPFIAKQQQADKKPGRTAPLFGRVGQTGRYGNELTQNELDNVAGEAMFGNNFKLKHILGRLSQSSRTQLAALCSRLESGFTTSKAGEDGVLDVMTRDLTGF